MVLCDAPSCCGHRPSSRYPGAEGGGDEKMRRGCDAWEGRGGSKHVATSSSALTMVKGLLYPPMGPWKRGRQARRAAFESAATASSYPHAAAVPPKCLRFTPTYLEPFHASLPRIQLASCRNAGVRREDSLNVSVCSVGEGDQGACCSKDESLCPSTTRTEGLIAPGVRGGHIRRLPLCQSARTTFRDIQHAQHIMIGTSG